MDVSIIIPVFNRLDLTQACLNSLERTLAGVDHEVILIDDGSTDGTRDYLGALRGTRHRVVLNDAPRGYALNNNAGARRARAPMLCLLNNDTVLMPGWFEPMQRLLQRELRAGCVGNVQREPFSGLIDHIGVTFNGEGVPIHAGKNDAAPPREEHSRWPAVTAACCLVRQEVFLGLDGFDAGFRNGFEDIDFCLRAAQAGFRHFVANRSLIYHYVSASPGRHRYELENLQRFQERWGRRASAFLRQREERRQRWLKSQLPAFADYEAWREQWELSRLARKARRREIADGRADGWRYLRKHLGQPWRYSYHRVGRAIAQITQPLPDLMPLPPKISEERPDAEAGVEEMFLFDPPRQ